MLNRLAIPRFSLVALMAGLILSSTAATWGGVKEVLTLRRTLGLAFLGGSAALAVKGFEFHDDANGFYDDYQKATDPVEIDRLYQRTTNRDVKSQVSWALAGAFAISGVRLLLTGNPSSDRRPERSARYRPTAQKRSESNRFLIEPRLRQHREIGIELKKPFF